MSETTTLFLGLGSNVGPRLAHIRKTIRDLDRFGGLTVEAVSPVYESVAHTLSGQDKMGDFLNAVVRLSTELDPLAVLDVCLSIESSAGRKREPDLWLPRTIDIDILAFGDRTIKSERLTIPHPRLAERRFVLLPFADLDRDVRIPSPFSSTVGELLEACPDRLGISRRYPAAAVFCEGGVADAA